MSGRSRYVALQRAEGQMETFSRIAEGASIADEYQRNLDGLFQTHGGVLDVDRFDLMRMRDRQRFQRFTGGIAGCEELARSAQTRRSNRSDLPSQLEIQLRAAAMHLDVALAHGRLKRAAIPRDVQMFVVQGPAEPSPYTRGCEALAMAHADRAGEPAKAAARAVAVLGGVVAAGLTMRWFSGQVTAGSGSDPRTTPVPLLFALCLAATICLAALGEWRSDPKAGSGRLCLDGIA